MRECEELLNNGVSAMEENGKRLLTVVFQQHKRRDETIAGRCCFVDEGM
jgi:hypothetical protein